MPSRLTGSTDKVKTRDEMRPRIVWTTPADQPRSSPGENIPPELHPVKIIRRSSVVRARQVAVPPFGDRASARPSCACSRLSPAHEGLRLIRVTSMRAGRKESSQSRYLRPFISLFFSNRPNEFFQIQPYLVTDFDCWLCYFHYYESRNRWYEPPQASNRCFGDNLQRIGLRELAAP